VRLESQVPGDAETRPRRLAAEEPFAYDPAMPSIDDLAWIPSRREPIPPGDPERALWVKLGWAAFRWVWHPEPGLWGPEGWVAGSNSETVAPGARRGDMAWAWGR
jgi:hypothetical protein